MKCQELNRKSNPCLRESRIDEIMIGGFALKSKQCRIESKRTRIQNNRMSCASVCLEKQIFRWQYKVQETCASVVRNEKRTIDEMLYLDRVQVVGSKGKLFSAFFGIGMC